MKILQSEIETIDAIRPNALMVFGDNWQHILELESLNYEVFARSLVECVTEQNCGNRIVIRGISPVTRLICERLVELPYDLAIDPLGRKTNEQEMYRVPLRCDTSFSDIYINVFPQDKSFISQGHKPVLDLRNLDVQRFYTVFLENHRQKLAETLNGYIASDQNLIIFVSKNAYYNQLRMSTALRRKGFRTVAVIFNPDLEGHKSGYFDDVITTDLLSFILWLREAKNVVLHTQGWLFRYHIPVLIDAFLPPHCTQVVELMDLNSFLLPENQMEELLPYMQATWGEHVEQEQRLQVKCEQYIANNCDGIIYQGSDRHIDIFGARGSNREARWLQFLSYPLADFFSKRQPHVEQSSSLSPRLVFAGGIPPINSKHPAEIFGDAQMVATVETILQQGLTLHVYNNPLRIPSVDYPHQYAQHIEFERRYSEYRFFRGEMPWKIANILAEYDLGLIAYDYSDELLVGPEHFKTLIPAKLFMYLEAGLPILVSRRAEATAEFVEKNGCGIGITDSELHSLPEFLRTIDLSALRRGALEARQRLSIDQEVHRLINFYESCSG